MVDITFDASGGSKMITFTFGQKAIKKGNIGYNTEGDFQYEEIEKTTNKISIKVTGDENTQGKEGFVYPTVDNKQCDSKGIRITQKELICDCSGLTITSVPHSSDTSALSSGYHAAEEIANFTMDSCIPTVSAISSDGWLELRIEEYEGFHIVANVDKNDTTSARTATTTISYSAKGTPCTQDFYVVQAASTPVDPCEGKQCNEMTVTTTLHRYLNCSGESNVEFATLSYTSNCVTNITAETDVDWLTASASNDKVYISAQGQETPSDLRTANVTVSWEVDGQNCDSGLLPTGQNGCSPTCSCGDFVLQNDGITVVAGKSGTLAYTANCTTNHSIATNDRDVATASMDNGIITINGVKSGHTLATITYDADGAQEPCTQTIEIEVICPTINITFNRQVDCSGATSDNPVIFTINE